MLNKNHFVYIQVRKYKKEHGDNDTYVWHSHDDSSLFWSLILIKKKLTKLCPKLDRLEN